MVYIIVCLVPVGENAKRILNNPSGPGQTIVKYPFIRGHEAVWIGLHQPGLEGEGVVGDDGIWAGDIVTRQGLIWGDPQVTIVYELPKGTVSKHASVVTSETITSKTNTEINVKSY